MKISRTVWLTRIAGIARLARFARIAPITLFLVPCFLGGLLGGLAAASAAAPAGNAAPASKVVVKLATLAPKESSWHAILVDMGEAWKQASGGTVELKIYAGTLGDETDIMRRIRIGQLDAAAVTTVGLATVDNSSMAFALPMCFASDEELDYVRQGVAGQLERALREKGFLVLNWGDAGWLRFFTKEPVTRPDDLRRLKVFVWSTGNALDELWKKHGFQAIPLAATDILPGLQTGMITALPSTPLATLANQWFPFLKYLTDLKWSPLTGATIITETAWNKIPAALQPTLLEIAQQAGTRMRSDIRRMEPEAIEAMAKRGVKTVPVPAEAVREWRELAESAYPELRGTIIPADVFDETLRLRDEFRASHPARRP